MARTADHDARRRQMARAARDVALDEGLSGVTVASVARRAGVSVGLVQHYFSSKGALMQRVFVDLLADVDSRVATIVEQGEEEAASIREMAALGLAELLPLDAARIRECQVRREFHALAAGDEGIAVVARDSDRAFRERLAGVVRNAQRCGEAASDVEPRRVAQQLWVTVVGIGATMLLDPSLSGTELLRDAVTSAFPHPCGRQRAVM